MTKEEKLQYRRETYAWRKEHGICVECGKEDAYKSSVRCLECKMQKREYSKKSYEQHKADKVYMERRNEKSRALYRKMREQQRCIRCNRPTDNGDKSYCKRCAVIVNKHERDRTHALGVLPKDMCGNGVYCAICSKPVEEQGKKLCNRCYESCCTNLIKARANVPYDCYMRRAIDYQWKESISRKEKYNERQR